MILAHSLVYTSIFYVDTIYQFPSFYCIMVAFQCVFLTNHSTRKSAIKSETALSFFTRLKCYAGFEMTKWTKMHLFLFFFVVFFFFCFTGMLNSKKSDTSIVFGPYGEFEIRTKTNWKYEIPLRFEFTLHSKVYWCSLLLLSANNFATLISILCRSFKVGNALSNYSAFSLHTMR